MTQTASYCPPSAGYSSQQPLNPNLYAALQSAFGHVGITHEGEERRVRLSPNHNRFGPSFKTDVVEFGEQYMINCPFCNDHKQKCWVSCQYGLTDRRTNSSNRHLFHCYRSDCHREPDNWRSLWNKLVAAGYRSDSVQLGTATAAPAESAIPAPVQLPPGGVPLRSLPPDHPACQYIRDRGFNPVELSLRWQLAYLERNQEVEPHFDGPRILIPIYGLNSQGKPELRGWQGRSIDRQQPKYLTSKGMPKSQLLYNLHRACRTKGPLVICEGVFDALRVGENAVALFGCTISRAQVQLLAQYAPGRDLVVLLDQTAQQEAQEVRRQLDLHGGSRFGRVVQAHLPAEIADPGEGPTAKLRECIAASLQLEQLPSACRTHIVNGHRQVPSQNTVADLGDTLAIQYWESAQRQADAPAPLLGALCGQDRKVRVVTSGVERFLNRLQGKQRIYQNALASKLTELRHQLPAAESFEDLQGMRELLTVAGCELVEADQSTAYHQAQVHPGLDVPLAEMEAAVAYQSRAMEVNCLRQALAEVGLLDVYDNIEKPCLQPLAAMMHQGICLDLQVLEGLSEGRYSQVVKQLVEAAQDTSACVYPQLDPLGTETGRITCTNPALQGVPAEVRSGLRASPSHTLLLADYSEFELRVLAELANCTGLQEAFAVGGSVHRHTASLLFGVSREQVTDQQRQVGKAVNFSVIYGMAARGLTRKLGCSPEEAQRHIDRFFEEFPEIAEWKEGVLKQAYQEGYVSTKYGRQRWIDDLNSEDDSARLRGERQAVNTVVQGTAADIFKLALARVYQELPNCHLLLPIHDALLVEVPEDSVQEAREQLRESMQVPPPAFQVPLVVEVKSGTHWGDCR